eukprot:1948378-Ditylum_brightwellii.AAC.2
MAPLRRCTGVCQCFSFPHPPHPRKTTTSTGNLKFRCICTNDYPSLVPECHLWRRFDWEGGGEDVGGAMA